MYGPARLFSTENFEEYNGVIRGAIFLSNRQGTSQDLSNHFSSRVALKTLAKGGGRITSVVNYFNKDPQFCSLLFNEGNSTSYPPGLLRNGFYQGTSHRPKKHTIHNFPNQNKLRHGLWPYGLDYNKLVSIVLYKSAMCCNGDICHLGSSVVLSPENGRSIYCRIAELVHLSSNDINTQRLLESTGMV